MNISGRIVILTAIQFVKVLVARRR